MKLKDSIAIPLLPAFPPNRADNFNEEKMEQYVNAVIESELEELRKIRGVILDSGIRFSGEYRSASERIKFILEKYKSLETELNSIKDGIKRNSMTTVVDGNDMCDWGWTNIEGLHANLRSGRYDYIINSKKDS
jgi:hypothetical protein